MDLSADSIGLGCRSPVTYPSFPTHCANHVSLSNRILGMFTSQQWKHLSNDFLKTQQEKRHSWFKASGTIKKFRAGLSIFSPIPKYSCILSAESLCLSPWPSLALSPAFPLSIYTLLAHAVKSSGETFSIPLQIV